MPQTPTEIIRAILDNPTDIDVVSKLMAADATYVSLNYDTPDLKRIMPWAGTSRGGAKALVETYTRVGRCWANEGFEVEDVIESADKVAVFGRFTYRSNTLGRAVTSPFAILARVADGQVTYMQFMEDTFATARSFLASGEGTYRPDPDGGEVVL